MREDQEDDGVGKIGSMSPDFEAHFFAYRIMQNFGVGFDDFEKYWTFDRISEANAYLDILNDYKRAWQAHYEIKAKR